MLIKFLKSSDKNFAQKSSILAFFWAYVGQPDDHKGWVKSKPFATIYFTHPRTNPLFFVKNIENWWFWKTFRVGHFGFYEKLFLKIRQNFNDYPATLGTEMFGVGDFWLETRVIIKIVNQCTFFESAILKLFFLQNFLFLVYWLARNFRNFDHYPDFQPKITHPKLFCPECTAAQDGPNGRLSSSFNFFNYWKHLKLNLRPYGTNWWNLFENDMDPWAFMGLFEIHVLPGKI